MLPNAEVTVMVTRFRPVRRPVLPVTEAVAAASLAVAVTVTEPVRAATSKMLPAVTTWPLTTIEASDASRLSGVT